MLKSQIRVLGLAASRRRTSTPRVIAGAVFRGSLWLEGVMTILLDADEDVNAKLAREILGSKYHTQIRAILLDSSPLLEASPRILARRTSLPVLLFKRRTRRKIRVSYAGCDLPTAERILEVSTGKFQLPEAVRVAKLLVRALRR